MKSEEGNKATFSHWPRLDTLFATQARILLWRLLEAKTSKKAVLSARCLRSVFFMGSKGCFMSSLGNSKVPLWEIPGTFGKIPVTARNKPVKVRALRDMETCWAQGVNKGRLETINGRQMPDLILVQVHEEV